MNGVLSRVVRLLFLSVIVSAGIYFISVLLIFFTSKYTSNEWLRIISDWLLLVFVVALILFVLLFTIFLIVRTFSRE